MGASNKPRRIALRESYRTSREERFGSTVRNARTELVLRSFFGSTIPNELAPATVVEYA